LKKTIKNYCFNATQSKINELYEIASRYTIIQCFSSRLYGLRKYKKKIKEMIYEKDN